MNHTERDKMKTGREVLDIEERTELGARREQFKNGDAENPQFLHRLML